MERQRKDQDWLFGIVRFVVEWAWWGSLVMAPLVFVFMLLGDSHVHARVDVLPKDESLLDLSARGEESVASLTNLSADLTFPIGSAPPILVVGFVGGLLLIWFLLYQVRGIVRSVREEPFTPANATRLARIGWGLLGFEFGLLLLSWVLNPVVREFQGGELSPFLEVDTNLLYPLFFFILAHVFRRGTRLEQEQELTV